VAHRHSRGRTTRRLTLVGGAPKKDVTRRLTLVPGGAPKKDVDVGDEGEPSHRIRLVQWNEVTDSNSRKTVPRVKKVSKGKKEKRPQKTATQSKASITRRDISVGGGSGRNNEKKRRRIWKSASPAVSKRWNWKCSLKIGYWFVVPSSFSSNAPVYFKNFGTSFPCAKKSLKKKAKLVINQTERDEGASGKKKSMKSMNMKWDRLLCRVTFHSVGSFRALCFSLLCLIKCF